MRPVARRGNLVPVGALETGHHRGEPRIEPRRGDLWTFGCASARDARASGPERRGRSDTPMSPHGGARLRRRGRTFCRPSQRRSARDGCGRPVSTSRSGISSGPRLLSSARRSSREGWWGRCPPVPRLARDPKSRPLVRSGRPGTVCQHCSKNGSRRERPRASAPRASPKPEDPGSDRPSLARPAGRSDRRGRCRRSRAGPASSCRRPRLVVFDPKRDLPREGRSRCRTVAVSSRLGRGAPARLSSAEPVTLLGEAAIAARVRTNEPVRRRKLR
jgi:hypothetical protein